jgi:hypothetical protein
MIVCLLDLQLSVQSVPITIKVRSLNPAHGVLMWRSDLFVEETEYTEKTTDLPQVTDKLCHIMLYLVHLTVSRIQTSDFNCDRH